MKMAEVLVSIFYCHVFKDSFCDFLFAYLEDEVFTKWGLLLKEERDRFFKLAP